LEKILGKEFRKLKLELKVVVLFMQNLVKRKLLFYLLPKVFGIFYRKFCRVEGSLTVFDLDRGSQVTFRLAFSFDVYRQTFSL